MAQTMDSGRTEVGAADHPPGLIKPDGVHRLVKDPPYPFVVESPVRGTGQQVGIMAVTQCLADLQIVFDLPVHCFGYRNQPILFNLVFSI